MAASLVMDIFGAVLTGRSVEAAQINALIRSQEKEGLYLEYKRGAWLDPGKPIGHEMRAYTSSFANAEGGLLAIGIVGGEDAQGAQRWSIEGPKCPDRAGWDAWLSHVLEPISARTRIRWQVVQVEGQEVIVVATDRAEALIRVYEKPNLVCYLRTGDETIQIDDTLFADLALGRRAKPDLRLTVDSIHGGSDSGGFYVNVSITVHNDGLIWVPGLRVAWVGYAHHDTHAQESLWRHLDIRPTTAPGPPPVAIVEFRGRVASHDGDARELRPFDRIHFGTRFERLPPSEEPVQWAWAGAIVVIPRDGTPLWAQLAITGRGRNAPVCRGWVPSRGDVPIVAWMWDRENEHGLVSIFGDRLPR